jgi:hypothetical protein
MSHPSRARNVFRPYALLWLPCVAAGVVLLASCTSTGGSSANAAPQDGGPAAQSCDEARARVEGTLWPSGPEAAPRLAPGDVPRYVATAGKMLSACSAIATAAHRREKELSLTAAEDIVRKDLAQMVALDATGLAAMVPAHAQHVRRYVALTQALRGRFK